MNRNHSGNDERRRILQGMAAGAMGAWLGPLLASNPKRTNMADTKAGLTSKQLDAATRALAEARYAPRLFERSLGMGWAANTVNTAIYRASGLLTTKSYQFGAFHTTEGSIRTFNRALDSGEITFGGVKTDISLADAHNIVSLGIDAGGKLHMAFGKHNGALNYYRSAQPFAVDAWQSADMTGNKEGTFTYPIFLSRNVDGASLVFLHRDGSAVNAGIRMKVYDEQEEKWSDLEFPLLSGEASQPTSCPYLNTPVVDKDGKIHLFFTWRTASNPPTGRVRNHNLGYISSSDASLTAWSASNGSLYSLPVTPVTSETALGTTPAANLMNQGGAAVDAKGHVFAASYMDHPDGWPQYFLLWRDADGWRKRWIRTPKIEFALLGKGTLRLPISRPALAADRHGTIWMIFRAAFTGDRLAALPLRAPNYEADWTGFLILFPDPVGMSEPVIDSSRLVRDGILSLLVQNSDQGNNEGLGASAEAEVRVIDVALG